MTTSYNKKVKKNYNNLNRNDLSLRSSKIQNVQIKNENS